MDISLCFRKLIVWKDGSKQIILDWPVTICDVTLDTLKGRIDELFRVNDWEKYKDYKKMLYETRKVTNMDTGEVVKEKHILYLDLFEEDYWGLW